jgi:hypothetical protein
VRRPVRLAEHERIGRCRERPQPIRQGPRDRQVALGVLRLERLELALEEVEDRKRFNVWAHRERQETERANGYAFSDEEHADIRQGLREAHEAGDPNASYGDNAARRFPDGLPDKTNAEALADAIEDTQIREGGGLTREAA